MNQHVYFNILDDQVCPSADIFMMSKLLTPPFFKMTTVKLRGLEAHVSGVMNTHTPYHTSTSLQNHLTSTPLKICGNLVNLRDLTLSEWIKLNATYLQNLVNSLFNRIQAVTKA
ncbi:hypothetical protein AVEN_127386-1 [Araneus ventricosus]|uniref:Uncharacterized protein n=1 Tax=Araneus ventricosus TaxID=182803 RepID=A0A4Y2EV44_ARAVE|nr:hypothetical protein AVEN_127386-1 [Araneus ventricosus]